MSRLEFERSIVITCSLKPWKTISLIKNDFPTIAIKFVLILQPLVTPTTPRLLATEFIEWLGKTRNINGNRFCVDRRRR